MSRLCRRLAIATIGMSCLYLQSAAPAFAEKAANEAIVLARVNGEEVRADDLLDQFSRRHAGHARFLGGAAEARGFLDLMIDSRLLVQEAFLIGLDEEPEAQEALGKFIDVQSSDLVVKREVEEKSDPTESEIAQVWQNELTIALLVREVLVERRSDADSIRVSILSGVDTDLLARTCSIARSSRHGGNRLIRWGVLDPVVEDLVFALEPGELSPVIETEEGYQIILVIDRFAESRPVLEEVKPHIASVLQGRKLEQRKADFSRELWDRYQVTVQDVDLSPAALLLRRLRAPDTVLAAWDGGELTLRDLAEVDELREWARLSSRPAVIKVRERLRMTVNAPLTLLEARRRGLSEEPELRDRIEDYREVVAVSLLFRDHVFRGLTVTDEEERDYFEEHRAEFVQAEERRVAHIMVATEEDASDVREELLAGANFEGVAKKRSRDFASALSGGELGWITEVKVPPAFREVLTMERGEVSGPIQGQSGWHIVKVLEIRPARMRGFEEIRDSLTERALEEKKLKARQFWIDRLRAAAAIEIDEAAIDRFVEQHGSESLDAPSPQHEIPAGALRPHD